jgi:putative ABC transport system permease protein
MKDILRNRPRSTLTVAIIAVGIISLVSIQTAIGVVSSMVNGSFGKMGSNSMVVSGNYHSSKYHPLEYSRMALFSQEFKEYSSAIFCNYALMQSVSSSTYTTPPNVNIIGYQGDYLKCASVSIRQGRDISPSEHASGSRVAILGYDLCNRLYGSNYPIGERVLVGGESLIVIGTLCKVGTFFGSGADNSLLIPLTLARELEPDTPLMLSLIADGANELPSIRGEVTKVMRQVKALKPNEADDFIISTNEALISNLDSLTTRLRLIAFIIGIVTLVGASFALMNIMFASVKERTREIGIKKSLGATSLRIGTEFIMESIAIGEAGAVIGVIMGILAGNTLAIYFETEFILPWLWVIISVIIALIVSLLAGYFPAAKAARLDPIETLRYE